MSRWTHIVATFRCDWMGGEVAPEGSGLRLYEGELLAPEALAERVIGRELHFPEINGLGIDTSPEELDDAFAEYDRLWEKRQEHPEDFLPCGSEGSCTLFVNEEGYGRWAVTVVGDLRDFGGDDDIQSVCEWFERACSQVAVLRQATCSIIDECVAEPVMLESGSRCNFCGDEE